MILKHDIKHNVFNTIYIQAVVGVVEDGFYFNSSCFYDNKISFYSYHHHNIIHIIYIYIWYLLTVKSKTI